MRKGIYFSMGIIVTSLLLSACTTASPATNTPAPATQATLPPPPAPAGSEGYGSVSMGSDTDYIEVDTSK